MNREILTAALAALALPSIAFAQGMAPAGPNVVTAPPSQESAAPAPAAAEDLVKVALDTKKGRIVLALDRGRAPLSTAYFLKYVDSHRLDGESFYRAMHSDGGGLIQGGITSDSRKLYPPVAHEPTAKTGLHNTAGTISFANAGAGTARGDFFILLDDTPYFDSDAKGGDGVGFAAFGHVIEGMDVVKAIYDSPTSPTKGVGVMKGQMLDPVVKITKASRVD